MHKKVLVIDDDSLVQIFIRRTLEKAGMKVTCCPDGYAGVAKIRDEEFDLVILDIDMPYMNGMQVLEQVASFEHDKKVPPILMLTSDGSKAKVMLAASYGVAGYMIKPPKKEDLIDRAAKLLGAA